MAAIWLSGLDFAIVSVVPELQGPVFKGTCKAGSVCCIRRPNRHSTVCGKVSPYF